MKGFFRLYVILAIIGVFLFPHIASSQQYTDVSKTHKHFDAIINLSEEKIINGYSNGSFGPEKTINRAEALKVLIGSHFDKKNINRAIKWHKEKDHWYVNFFDVKIDDWFSPYVEIGYKNNIIKGYSDNNFKPSDPINFAEALKIILETYDVDFNGHFVETNLLYVENNKWFTKYFAFAQKHNLLNDEKFYHPGQLITRSEFVEIIYRLRQIKELGLKKYNAPSYVTSNEYTITVPRLNIVNIPIYFADPFNEKKSLEILKKGLGHYLSAPNKGRKTVVFGHSSGYSWDNSPYKELLRKIDRIQSGDKIYINYKEKGYVYSVFKSDIISATKDYKIMENQGLDELVLYTCWPPSSISHRYIVYGKPI